MHREQPATVDARARPLLQRADQRARSRRRPAGCSTPRRMRARPPRAADVGAPRRRARASARRRRPRPPARRRPRPSGSRAAPRRSGRTAAPRRRRGTGAELGLDRVGDRGSRPRSGTRPTRSSSSGSRRSVAGARSARKRSARVAVRLGRRAAESSAPERSSDRVGARRRRARGTTTSPSVSKPGRGGDVDPPALRGGAGSAQLRRARGTAATEPSAQVADAGRARRGSRGPQMPSAARPALRWNSRSAAVGVGAEDAVLAPGVEAERVQPALELGDVVAAQHRAARGRAAGRRGAKPLSTSAAQVSGPHIAVDPEPARRPGTRGPRARSRRRSCPARRRAVP